MYPKHICLTFCLILSILPALRSQRIVTYGLQINPGLSIFSVKTPDGMTDFKKINKPTVNAGLTGNYYLGKMISVSSGLLSYNYGFEISGNHYYAEINTRDSEGKSYIRKIWGEQIKEKTSFALIQIPLVFQFEYPLTRDIHPFISAGPGFSFPIHSKTEGSGIFTYKGYYPDGNYTLEDIPVYGFSSDVPVSKNGPSGMRLISIQGMVTAGCTFTMSRYWRFITFVNYAHALGKPTKKNDGGFSLSNELGSYYSIAGSDNGSLNMISIGICIRKVLLF